jgi:serine protease Do
MAETVWCTQCGSVFPSTDRFCLQCGAENVEFDDTQTIPVPSSEPLPTSPAPPPFSPPVPGPTGGRRGLIIAGLILLGVVILGAGSFAGIRLASQGGTANSQSGNTSASQLSTHVAPSGTSASSKPAEASNTPTTAADFAALYAQAGSGVVRIETVGCNAQGVGTGFLLSPTLVATVHHVIADSEVISLIAGSQRTTGTVIGSDPSTDLALVRASRPLTGHNFQLADVDPAVGSGVAAIGFPIGDPITLTVGHISGLERNITVGGNSLTGLIETDTPINPGNSGGPLMTLDGKVGGLVDADRLDANGIAYAVPARVAASKYALWQVTPQPLPAATCSNPLGPPQQADPNLAAPTAGNVTATQAAGIAAAFNTYFGGINTGNYAAAWAVLSPKAQAQTPFAQFQTGASYDSDLQVLDAHSLASSRVLVTLSFNSLQAPAKGPNGETCDNWTLDYTLIQAGDGGWQIDASAAHNGSTHTPC